MGILAKLGKAAAGLVVKKVTTVEPDGEEITRARPREGVKGIGWIAGFLIAWHFFFQPVLSYHFPQYAFPALDFGWLTGLFMGM